LRPHIKVSETETKRQIVIGTVEGDIHDIGKNLVKIMFEAAGWTVHDLGRDVLLSKFVEEQKRIKSDVLTLSALMTMSMLAMPKVIDNITWLTIFCATGISWRRPSIPRPTGSWNVTTRPLSGK